MRVALTIDACGRFRVFCDGPAGVFIIGEGLMEGVRWLLSELASEAMASDEVALGPVDKLG